MPLSVMSFVTTAPAPITAPSHTVTGNIVTLEHIETFFPIVVVFQTFLSPAGPPFENKSLTNITPCPTKQSFPMLTPSQIKLCDCTRVRSPTTTLLCISTKGPTKQLSPILHSYKLTGCTSFTSFPKTTSRICDDKMMG